MEKELLNSEKQLLLADLCARLPYEVKVAFLNEDLTYHSEPKTLTGIECINNLNYSSLEDEDGNTTIVEFVKPYLLPLSSMTEEQKNQLKAIWSADMDKAIDYAISGEDEFCDLCQLSATKKVIDWFNANQFDYRGLIEKGLAIDATELNIY